VHAASAEVSATTETTTAVPASAEATTTVPATTAATVAAATTTSSSSSEHRWRKGKRHTKRARDETTEKLVGHPIPPELKCDDGYRRKKHMIRRAKRRGYFK
jgi:hypothetical protein